MALISNLLGILRYDYVDIANHLFQLHRCKSSSKHLVCQTIFRFILPKSGEYNQMSCKHGNNDLVSKLQLSEINQGWIFSVFVSLKNDFVLTEYL